MFPLCGEHIVKNGRKRNKQRYLCRDCGKSFCALDERIEREYKRKRASHSMFLGSIESVVDIFTV